ncbi:hypothetical protein GNI_058000 [Gregarina niphandrodes]|uniref:GATA zinc finger protein n=1 Tax=Gregarina niphandrodes TaxID=110365 RepID=A0A023B8P3_GRENI|nr:hypothetical protein GNI_058000 [Gregarina niphandrodes]EZG69412.1 hypothetical protein GNI_058000 [Gregarina niphandrodes]|eukprot:XP_011130013.1 hypothetical protein GNI_058000 [Gregarina niphandrodes]
MDPFISALFDATDCQLWKPPKRRPREPAPARHLDSFLLLVKHASDLGDGDAFRNRFGRVGLWPNGPRGGPSGPGIEAATEGYGASGHTDGYMSGHTYGTRMRHSRSLPHQRIGPSDSALGVPGAGGAADGVVLIRSPGQVDGQLTTDDMAMSSSPGSVSGAVSVSEAVSVSVPAPLPLRRDPQPLEQRWDWNSGADTAPDSALPETNRPRPAVAKHPALRKDIKRSCPTCGSTNTSQWRVISGLVHCNACYAKLRRWLQRNRKSMYKPADTMQGFKAITHGGMV